MVYYYLGTIWKSFVTFSPETINWTIGEIKNYPKIVELIKKWTESNLILCELMDNLTENNPFDINETSSNFDLSTLQCGFL